MVLSASTASTGAPGHQTKNVQQWFKELQFSQPQLDQQRLESHE